MIYLLIDRCNAPKGCNKNLRRKNIILVGMGFLILLMTARLTEGLQVILSIVLSIKVFH